MNGNTIFKFDIFGDKIVKYDTEEIEIVNNLNILLKNIETVESNINKKSTEEIENISNHSNKEISNV